MEEVLQVLKPPAAESQEIIHSQIEIVPSKKQIEEEKKQQATPEKKVSNIVILDDDSITVRRKSQSKEKMASSTSPSPQKDQGKNAGVGSAVVNN